MNTVASTTKTSKRELRVTFIIGGLGAGGKERQLLYLIKSLPTYFKITIIVLSSEIFYKEIYELPIDLTIVEKTNKYRLTTICLLYRQLRKARTQIVHSWDDIGTILIIPYILLNKISLITSIRHAGKLKRSFKQSLIKTISHWASNCIVSNSQKGLEVERLLNNKKGKVIYNGLDLKNFDCESNKKVDTHLKYIDYKIKIVMVGRFYGLKDYITFIRAAKLVTQSYSNVGFICIGDGPNRINAEAETRDNLNTNIFFLGNRNDIPSLLKKMDIGVLLNNTKGHAEGISNAIMEYMAAGLPVIATDAGGTPELVQNNVTGFLVPAFDEKEVAQKIQWLIENSLESEQMGLNGQKVIETRFSINKMADAYINLYNGLC